MLWWLTPELVPADALTPAPNNKRSTVPNPLVSRDYSSGEDFLNIGDRPWYCFWNSTISEFWMFLDQNITDDSSASTTTAAAAATITSMASVTTKTPHPGTQTSTFQGTSASIPTHQTDASSLQPASTAPYPSEATDVGYDWEAGSTFRKTRRMATGVGSSDFPKLVKMVEKRKPGVNIQPYCQQMQVLNNWQIMPIPDVPTIAIQESEFAPAAITGGSKRAVRRRAPDTIQQLGSNCICEWFSE